jgi:L-ascorbate metabolism protein UlaG (beta-lactamase superfamily)
MALDRDTTFTWHGHACVEIRTPGGLTILIDPWFGNPKSDRRAADVKVCDVMLVTHGHFDHLGGNGEGPVDAIDIAERTKPWWPAMHELSLWLAGRLKSAADGVVGMNQGGTVDARGVKVTMVPAVHSSGDVFGGNTPAYLGSPVGFVIELENGLRVYCSGDTTVFGDMRLIRDLYTPELAIVPIGGHFTMGPREAALAVDMLGVKKVLPVHYGTFPILAGTPDALREELANRGVRDVEVFAPEPGGSIS